MAESYLGLREGENATRAGRLKKLKRGPGVFVYDGSLFDTEWVPTPLLTGKNEPVLDQEGMPVLDGAGRQVFKPAGKIETNDDGSVKLGGKPKVVRNKISVYKLRGYEFPEGEPVEVSAAVALKLRGMAGFVEIEPDAPESGEQPEGSPKKRGRKKKDESESAEG